MADCKAKNFCPQPRRGVTVYNSKLMALSFVSGLTVAPLEVEGKSQWPRDILSSPPLRFRLLISTSLIFCSIAVRD